MSFIVASEQAVVFTDDGYHYIPSGEIHHFTLVEDTEYYSPSYGYVQYQNNTINANLYVIHAE